MITAKQARELNPTGRIEEYKSFIEEKIREAALSGNDYVLIREAPYSSWLYNEQKLDDRAAVEVLKELRRNGFYLKYYQYDGSTFSDCAMQIYWQTNAQTAE